MTSNKLDDLYEVIKTMLENDASDEDILLYIKDKLQPIQLDLLKYDVYTCDSCKNAVLAYMKENNKPSNIMIIQDMHDDTADELLNTLMNKLSEDLQSVWNLDNIYVTNLLKCELEDITNANVAHCKKFIEEEISIIKPKYIVCMGRYACQTIIHPKFDIQDDQFKFYGHISKDIQMLGTYGLIHLLELDEEDEITRKKDIFHTFEILHEAILKRNEEDSK